MRTACRSTQNDNASSKIDDRLHCINCPSQDNNVCSSLELIYWEICVGWRRGRDSNPRDGHPPTPLAGERLRPLGHLSNYQKYRKKTRRTRVFRVNDFRYTGRCICSIIAELYSNVGRTMCDFGVPNRCQYSSNSLSEPGRKR